jgi:hypothetical protein
MLHPQAVQNYAQQFAHKLLEKHNKEVFSGADILNISTIDQVNVFIVKELFDRWQATTLQLKSPFFDFDNEKVQTALQVFMNTVSQHILVQKTDLQPLIAAATAQSVELCLAPEAFLKNQNTANEADKAKLLKYTRIHNNFVKATLEGATAPLDDTENTILAFDAVCSMDPALLGMPPQQPVADSDAPTVADNFFDNLTTTMPSPNLDSEKPKIKIKADVVEKTEPTLLHEQYLTTQPTMNDTLKAEHPTFADQHQNSPIKNLNESISLNQKFIFINQLFNGDSQAFQETLEVLGACSSADEAINLLKYRYAPKYKWNLNGTEADELMDIVKRMV